MKNVFSLALVCLVSFSCSATIYRVNNSPDLLGVLPCATCFSTIQEAVTTAFPTDTIHIEASPMPYAEDVEITKLLTILGPGYFLTDNIELQWNAQTATVQRMSFLDGSSGTKVSGITFDYGIYTTLLFGPEQDYSVIEDIVIERCNIQSPITFTYYETYNNIEFSQNWMQDDIYSYDDPTCIINAINIHNNYIDGTIEFHDNVDGTIFQNTIFSADIDIYNTMNFFNNICIQPADNDFIENNNTCVNIHHNVFDQAIEWMADCDMNNYVLSAGSIFPSSGTIGSEADAVVYPEGACAACHSGFVAGGGDENDNEQMGCFGGLTPYIYGGIPAIPTIRILQGPAQAPENGTITIEVETQSNH